MMASSALRIEELALDEAEADALGNAVKEVADLYDIAPDPKVIAWAGLIGTASAIYAPRVMAYKMRRSAEKKEAKRHAPKEEAPPVTEHDPSADMVEVLPISAIS